MIVSALRGTNPHFHSDKTPTPASLTNEETSGLPALMYDTGGVLSHCDKVKVTGLSDFNKSRSLQAVYLGIRTVLVVLLGGCM